MLNDRLEFALQCLKLGINVIPLKPREKVPAIASTKPYFERMATEDEIRAWFTNTDNNIGLIMGKISSAFAYDVDGDSAKEYLKNTVMPKLSDETFRDFANTAIAQTGSGGMHFIFRYDPADYPNGISSGSLWIGKGGHEEIVRKGNGNYIVGLYSTHPNGNVYQLLTTSGQFLPLLLTKKQIDEIERTIKQSKQNVALDTTTIVDNTTTSNKDIKEPEPYPLDTAKMQELAKVISDSGIYRDGNRDRTIFHIAGCLRHAGVPVDNAKTVVTLIANMHNDNELPSRLRAVEQTYSKQINEVTGRKAFTEFLEMSLNGNIKEVFFFMAKVYKILGRKKASDAADEDVPSWLQITDRLLDKYTFKTTADTETIYRYDADSGIYVRDGERFIKEMAESYNPKIETSEVNAIIDKIKRRTFFDRSLFDRDTDHIVVKNGVLNLFTGELKPFGPEYLMTSRIPVMYDPNARCPKIIAFLKDVQDRDGILTIVKMLGYCLYKTAKYEKAFMFIGKGNNGKSVIIKLIEALLGHDNCSNISLQALETERFAPANLYGKMVNVFADLKSDRLKTTGIFKSIVSGDTITAEEKFKGHFKFRPFCKLIFSANRIPESDDKTYAFYRRWNILTFKRIFSGDEIDRNLIDKLTTEQELSGLLNLAIVGLRKLQKEQGFDDESVEKIKQLYETNSNSVIAFVNSNVCSVDLSKPDHDTKTTILYQAYEQYCHTQNQRPLDVYAFGGILAELGIVKKKKMVKGERDYYYLGVKLNVETYTKNQVTA